MTDIKTILYVEDDDDSRELLQFVLESKGYLVTTCSASEEGLKLARENSFSAIVLDHRLAEISGMDICRQIRTYDRKTPIIFYSASAYITDREAGAEAGADAYLVKPADLGRIAETIKRLVG